MLDERPESVAAFVSEQCGEVALCPNCFSPTFPGVHCCYVCMAPIGDYVAWLPYERIWATAWIVWKATWTVGARPIHAIAAVGCLLLIAVAAFAVVWVPSSPPPYQTLDSSVLNIILPALGIGYYGIIVVLCLRMIRNVRSSHGHVMSDVDDDAVDWDWGVETE